jgi:hypothetical protein
VIEQLWQKTGEWEFLDEPLYRWAIFAGAMGLILAGWAGIIRQMKGAV